MGILNRRSEDSLNPQIKEIAQHSGKRLIVHSVKARIAHLRKVRHGLEKKLVAVKLAASASLFSYLKNCSAIKKLKAEIAEVNGQMKAWIGAVHSYFVAT